MVQFKELAHIAFEGVEEVIHGFWMLLNDFDGLGTQVAEGHLNLVEDVKAFLELFIQLNMMN